LLIKFTTNIKLPWYGLIGEQSAIHHGSELLPPPLLEGYCFHRRLSVCLWAGCLKKVIGGFSWKFGSTQILDQRITDKILEVIRHIFCMSWMAKFYQPVNNTKGFEMLQNFQW